jgi:hypothetical protein
MFDIVAPHQQEAPAGVDRCVFDDRKSRLPSSDRAAEARAAESTNRPSCRTDQSKYDEECQEETHGEWHFRAEQIEHLPQLPYGGGGQIEFRMPNDSAARGRRIGNILLICRAILSPVPKDSILLW